MLFIPDEAHHLQRQELNSPCTMSLAIETTGSRVPLPLPTHFSYAEQSFSLKKRRLPFSSSSTSNSSYSSPARLSHSVPPLPPSKGCPPLSRMFPQQPSPWTPLSCSLRKSPPPDSVYDPSKQQSYFSQCFTNLGLLGRGSFGEVYKVQSNENGWQYAVKRSAHRFRGNSERNRSVREARNHERLCPHPHILNFVAAWEECGRLYIQTELCSTSLLLHAENKPPGPDEPAAWAYLCDLLSALQHLHSQGFVHLDLKPANVLITDSGRLKLGDFGLLLELKQKSTDPVEEKVKEDVQEGDPRYMAPELLCGEYGPAADVFSLGVSILELACNIEVPNGGEGWQQLRQGCLPSELTSGLSTELQEVLRMMLAPDPSERPTVSELLALPSVWKHRWKRRVYLMVAETMLTLVSLCQMVVCFGCRLLSSLHLSFLPHWTKPTPCTPPKDSWDKDLTLPLSAMHADSGSPGDDAVFMLDARDPELSPTFSHRVKSRLSVESTSTPLPGSQTHNHRSPAHTPTHSNVGDWSCNLAQTPSSIHSNGSCHILTPSASPIHAELHTGTMNKNSTHSQQSSSSKSSLQRGHNWLRTEEALPRPNFEPKNLLSLFEETTLEGQEP
ncbi:membrane-associated tyrosine- and threonine-specific cdc2-inhibitory kinase isoform X1 [Micropterus dolomieu]|uniref:membrane-associated tyrosine- and threonine-specific cdc2-inhibitory kinase isoform X1 n=2 Tax=Micropterus dolomieu TaxID=147949 RepID=UPI001E8CE8B0|nr:membrane-associated tyrosine- and threonine-specific cdc2-inhibitory kinase isoform X1 [Micropterus dolomieu]